PQGLSRSELEMAVISGMGNVYWWSGIAPKLAKRDIYYATIRYWGKKMIRQCWKDDENREYVQWLRDQLYSETRQIGHRVFKSVGVPDVLLQDSVGRLLQRFLGELGVTVVPLAEAAEGAAARARQTVDCLIAAR